MFRAWLFLGIMLSVLTARPQSGPPPLAVESFQEAWEIIRDTHFDTNYNGQDWNKLRAALLPKVQKARTPDEVREVIQEMLDTLGHSHLMILPGPDSASDAKTVTPAQGDSTPQEKAPDSPSPPKPVDHTDNGNIGLEVRVIDGQIVTFRAEPGSPAAKAGVKPGWIIHEIDGEPALDPTVKNLDHNPRQRDFLLWHNAAHLLKGGIGENCVLVIDKDSGAKETNAIERIAESGMPAKLGNLPTMFTRTETNELKTATGRRVGYIRFNLWMLPAVLVIDRFVDQYRNADGIIVDMRGNLGGIGGMVMGAAGHFVSERASLGQMKMRDNEINFYAFPRRVDQRQQPTNTFQGKLAILTDPITLSSAELFAGGMQELGRARVFGQPTGGQALPSVSDRLPNGDLLYHAVADFVTPKGKRLEGPGVTPDEIIPLRQGRDETLEAALKWLDKK